MLDPEKTVIWDIETAPLPEEELKAICPPFDPSEVKTGNLGPKKAAEKIAKAEETHFQSFRDKAALSPVSGRLVVVGLWHVAHGDFWMKSTDDVPEKVAIESLFKEFGEMIADNWTLVGHNIFGFDLPWLIKRAAILGADTSHSEMLFQIGGRYVNWHGNFFDTRTLWQLGDTRAESNFELIGRALGTGGKSEGDCGKDFHKLWVNDRGKAVAYLKNDVAQPADWLRRFGLLPRELKELEL